MHDLPSHDGSHGGPAGSGSARTLAGVGLALAAYLVAAALGWPQHGRDLLVEAQAGHHTADHGDDHAPAAGEQVPGHDDHADADHTAVPPRRWSR